jgi:K+-transporting ATPase KdpF subunit
MLDPLLHGPDDTGWRRRQERVKTRQSAVNTGCPCHATAFTDRVIENIVAGVIALALIGYLVYALVKPDRF